MYSKYHNKKTEVHNILFDSKKESVRYQELDLLQRAKEISCLQLQPKFDLIVNGKKIGFYKADFSYIDEKTGKTIVEDTKGYTTQTYRIKKKLIKALYNIDIIET